MPEDNKPAPKTQVADDTTNADQDIEEQKEIARQAMEGAERTAERELEEKTQKLEEKTAEISKQLGNLKTEKEKLELAWIDLDNTRRKVRKLLEPVLVEEKKVEEEEAAIETEEAKVGVPSEKQAVEKKRWAIQDKRKDIEKRKWVEEDKMTRIEETINANTARYRQLLDEEDGLEAKLSQLKAEGGV